jgi:hypothetical protein
MLLNGAPAQRAPLDPVADFGKPGVSRCGVDEARRIRDTSALVVG